MEICGHCLAAKRRPMNPEETFRNWLEGKKQQQLLKFKIGGELIPASIFAVRADYVELNATFGTENYATQKQQMIRVPISAISWVE
jgi:hypothetical protein